MTLGYAMISQVKNQKHDEENTNECDVIKIKTCSAAKDTTKKVKTGGNFCKLNI